MSLRVESEVGRLRRVLVHRPGAEIDRMLPDMMGELLFDDILYGEEAQAEHDEFCGVLEAAGAQVDRARELVTEALAQEEAREWLLETLRRDYGVSRELCTRLAALSPGEIAGGVIAGARNSGRMGPRRPGLFELNPLPNYFFQRDPQTVAGDRVVICSMATAAREREPLLSRLIFLHHPDLQQERELLEIDRPPSTEPGRDPGPAYPMLEGGDLLVATPEILLVGISERTNRRGVEVLAEHLRREESTFRHLVVVELAAKRAYMHLDTVFTLIDERVALAYAPILETGPRGAHVYLVDLQAERLTFQMAGGLQETLSGLGFELDVVPCGGEDPIDQEREQWTDGANAFALAPGIAMLYQRNRRTVEALAGRGFRVLSERNVLVDGEEVLGRGPTVITISGNELSRARGGPRCMTMPLVRDAVGVS